MQVHSCTCCTAWSELQHKYSIDAEGTLGHTNHGNASKLMSSLPSIWQRQALSKENRTSGRSNSDPAQLLTQYKRRLHRPTCRKNTSQACKSSQSATDACFGSFTNMPQMLCHHSAWQRLKQAIHLLTRMRKISTELLPQQRDVLFTPKMGRGRHCIGAGTKVPEGSPPHDAAHPSAS